MIVEGLMWLLLQTGNIIEGAFGLLIPDTWHASLRQAFANWGLGLAGVVSQFFAPAAVAAFATVVIFGVTRFIVSHIMLAIRTVRSYLP